MKINEEEKVQEALMVVAGKGCPPGRTDNCVKPGKLCHECLAEYAREILEATAEPKLPRVFKGYVAKKDLLAVAADPKWGLIFVNRCSWEEKRIPVTVIVNEPRNAGVAAPYRLRRPGCYLPEVTNEKAT